MKTTMLDIRNERMAGLQPIWLTLKQHLHLIALGAILLLAAFLRFWNLETLGYANSYYTAAIESMLQSWQNFFFVAAEPGGSVTIDKPPLGLWLQAASAYIFGVNGFAVMLPQIIAGLLSVLLLYHLVQRPFGRVAGLLAALALAVTPVAIAVDRNNTMDSTLILTLLLAAWAFIKATESGKLRYLLLGATLVGLGFNIKMLQAYLPVPAFYALYFLGAAVPFRRKLVNLTLATILIGVVSLSWAIAVDLTPADQRPYIGSSTNNTVMELIIGHNGMNRLFGHAGPAGTQGDAPAFAPGAPPDGANATLGRPGDGQAMPDGGPGRPNDGGGPGGGGPGGGNEIGTAGVLRLFTGALNNEISWLLPFGLFGGVLLAFSTRPRWPLSPKHQALVLWGGWLLTTAIFFSSASFFHAYYLAMLGAPLAALVGIGTLELWRIRTNRPWLALLLVLGAVGVTLGLQIITATEYLAQAWWVLLAVGVAIAGAGLLVWAMRQNWQRGWAIGLTCLIAAILLIPTAWSGLTTMNPAANRSLPAAYDGNGSDAGAWTNGELTVNQELLDYLEAHTQDTTYLMAVPSAMQGADYVIATGRPVLYMGGFSGSDTVVNAEDLAQLVADGELRYIYWGGGGGPQASNTDISTWISSTCSVVTEVETATSTTSASTGDDGAGRPGGGGPGQSNLTLYDCAAGN